MSTIDIVKEAAEDNGYKLKSVHIKDIAKALQKLGIVPLEKIMVCLIALRRVK